MSIAACIVIAALLLIRQIRFLPKRVVYPLWGLAFYRLIMPFSLPTSWSLFNFTGGLVKRLITVETFTYQINSTPGPNLDPFRIFNNATFPVVQNQISSSRDLYMMNSIGAAQQYSPIMYKTETLRQVFTTGAVIWAIIAIAAIIAAVILYSLTHKELKKAVHIKDNLYRSDMLLSPIITGLIRPRIILPASLDPDSEEGVMILAHETIHKKRLDNLYALAVFIGSIHSSGLC
jgi:beta-lactamase regulating signal transducer with metallopeptidase domain